MAKEIFKRELVIVDFNKNIFKYYNIEVLSVGFNELQVITHQGKLGNNGRQDIQRIDKFKEAVDIAEEKFRQKKKEGYVEVALIKVMLGQHNKDKTNKKKKTEAIKKETNNYHCGSCGKNIPQHIHEKINEWGRGEGGWDKDINFIGYQKVLCIDCQLHYEIFKKKV